MDNVIIYQLGGLSLALEGFLFELMVRRCLVSLLWGCL